MSSKQEPEAANGIHKVVLVAVAISFMMWLGSSYAVSNTVKAIAKLAHLGGR